MDEKLLKDSRFLLEVRKLALSHMHDHIPEKDSELYMPYMWVNGVVDALRSRGYTIEKKENEIVV